MKKLNFIKIIFILSLMISSCVGNSSKDRVLTEAEKEIAYLDSIKIREQIDSMTQATMEKIRMDSEVEKDSISKKTCPIQITGIKFYTGEYSNYQTIRITYKNVGTKKVIGMKFRWYDCKNVFGDEIDFLSGYSGGWDDRPINPGKTNSGNWDLMEDGIKTGKAYCYEVVYEDGTKWEI